MHEGEETQITQIIQNDNQQCSCGGTYILQKFSREISKKLKEINQNCNWLLIKENEQSEKKVQIIQNKIKQSIQIQKDIQPKENKYFGYLEEQESKLNDLIAQKEALHQEILVKNLEIFQKKLQNLKEQKEQFEKKKQEKQIDEETKIKNLRENIQKIQPRKQQLEKLIQVEPIYIENLNNQLKSDQEYKQKKDKELKQNQQNIDKLEDAQQEQNPFMQTSIKNANQGGNNLFTLPDANYNAFNGDQRKNNKNQQINGRKVGQYSDDDDSDW
ncbi:hypothetical protein PPERSA_05739 [Pseudocohnilembus persalinus]|uniref:Uncharacterized protein n=1 Tax=Pseudocohnilembus persalinus TaxID=266149 RepID=A0A0V0QI81_PSEPJ|nr:hypothetical protein PPERSA_05739 [Pseudocohnilembus persalinus]|eukprot:KRX01900.1 hypothetical protein PPERSA_05739 [Pseudocohnilembus persalinus]